MKDFSANFTTRDSQVYTELDNFREAFKKKNQKNFKKCQNSRGGVWSGSMSKEKTIVSKSFLSNFKQF